jgi:hypothetical protein
MARNIFLKEKKISLIIDVGSGNNSTKHEKA